jgi:hypothetical protein
MDSRLAELDLGAAHVPVQLLVRGSIAAVVRRVSLADFTAEALQSRLGNASQLQAAVRTHNDVIQAVHQARAILPAKFGAVYERLEDVAEAVDRRAGAIQAQLDWLDGCDEWAVHVYVDRRIVQTTIQAELARGRAVDDLATAGPGRAYFLQRKLADDLAARTAQMTDDLAVAAYQRLARAAVDAVAERPAGPSVGADGEVEALKAAFLVRRERQDDFLDDVRACTDAGQAWRCTCSGPWPPYTFATMPEGVGDDRQDA